MSKKIPFLEMFAALRQWTEFVNAMSGWKIVEAAIDRARPAALWWRWRGPPARGQT